MFGRTRRSPLNISTLGLALAGLALAGTFGWFAGSRFSVNRPDLAPIEAQVPVADRTQLKFGGLANASGPFNFDSLLTGAAGMRPLVARTKTEPQYWLALYQMADGKWEGMAESIMEHGGMWEREETELCQVMLDECQGRNSLVLDVGGFVGYFSMLAALRGCSVRVWEGHPANAAMIRLSSFLNSLDDYITVYNRVASDSLTPMTFAGSGMDGHVANSYKNTDNPNFKEMLEKEGRANTTETGYTVFPLGIDEAVPQGEVLLLKVDIEGFEPSAFRSARRLVSQRRVKYIVTEYNMWRGMTLEQGVSMVMEFMRYGYSVYELPLGGCPLTQVTGREHMVRVSKELQNHTYKCNKWCTTLIIARDGLPERYLRMVAKQA